MRIGRWVASKERLLIISLAVIAACIWHRVIWAEKPGLRATFINVGQGDCILLTTPSGRVMLVDGGGKATESEDAVGMRVVEPFLRSRGVRRIDVLALTHPHDDHLRGLIPVLRDFRVGLVLDPAIPHGSKAYARFLSTIKRRHIPYQVAVRGQALDFGDGVRADLLNPPPVHLTCTRDDVNCNSIVMRLTYGNESLLLQGDAGAETEADILASGLPVRSDVLKVGHHGSESASSEAWLDAVKPRVAVISVGRNNPFGHPSSQTLSRLLSRGVKVYRTDRNGTVTIEFSPDSIFVRPAASSN